ncbi:uncharacterized protein METZ01_LOCUS209064 [marine metagenome]|uniref:Uncharacterized protein n=1 Tax=marine metagenome TaxID=408172 RepID=A0A382EZS4_9ZZZZ
MKYSRISEGLLNFGVLCPTSVNKIQNSIQSGSPCAGKVEIYSRT